MDIGNELRVIEVEVLDPEVTQIQVGVSDDSIPRMETVVDDAE